MKSNNQIQDMSFNFALQKLLSSIQYLQKTKNLLFQNKYCEAEPVSVLM